MIQLTVFFRVATIAVGASAALAAGLAASSAHAELAPLTPAQQQEAAAKKAAAAAKAEKEKKELANAMEKVASRWRERAEAHGWPVNQPTPVEALPGFQASAEQSGPSGQPGGKLGPATGALDIRSEKQGTAPPSQDVKKPSGRHGDLLPPSIYPQDNAERMPPLPAR